MYAAHSRNHRLIFGCQCGERTTDVRRDLELELSLISTKFSPKLERTLRVRIVCHLCRKSAYAGAVYRQNSAGPDFADDPRTEVRGMWYNDSSKNVSFNQILGISILQCPTLIFCGLPLQPSRLHILPLVSHGDDLCGTIDQIRLRTYARVRTTSRERQRTRLVVDDDGCSSIMNENDKSRR